MNNALTLLVTQDDWSKYQNMYAQAGGFSAGQIGWGKGPSTYPCLVSSFTEKGSVLTNAKRVVSCYVYVSDAQKLVETAQTQEAEPRLGAVMPGQASFNKAMMAHVMALIDTMVRSGICTKEQYEKWFAGMLSKSDQMSMEDMETIVRTIQDDEIPVDDDDDDDEDEDKND